MKLFKRIWMGAVYLEGYGHHPGWGMLGIYVLVSGLAGINKGGLNGFIFGSLFSLCFFGPIFLWGCWSRAKDYEQDMETTFDTLQKEYK